MKQQNQILRDTQKMYLGVFQSVFSKEGHTVSPEHLGTV